MDYRAIRGIYKILGFICGIICAVLAKRKNKSIWLAFFAGYFFTIFAVAYYILAKYEKVLQGERVITCKQCGELFVKSKTICPKCKAKNT